jgi:cell wall-associated NlpC family hydrolase
MAVSVSASASLVDDKRNAVVNAALDTAKAAAGKPYKYSGKTSSGFDCSGFVCYVYQQVFPAFQYMDTTLIEGGPWFIEVATLKPGDLIFFPAGQNPYEVKKKNKKVFPAHVGIVIDKDNWIGSQSSTGVAKVGMKHVWWSARDKKFLRYATLLP